MFLRILGGLLLLAAVIWLVMFLSAGAAMRDVRREQWPYGLGTIEDFDSRRDKATPSNEAKAIAKLMEKLPVDDATPDAYVAAQVAKKDDAIDPPADNAGLKGQDATIAALVQAVNGAGARIVWGAEGAPWQTDDTGFLLGAAALDSARGGNTARAWQQLHAFWLLAQSMATDPDGSRIGVRMKRAANAVARKLPPPVPAWSAEIAALEPRRDAAAIMLENTASRTRIQPALPGPLAVFRPISNWIEASNARRSRAAAESLTKPARCRISTADDVSFAEDIYRAARIEAELEATAKVLALKSERAALGRWPDTLRDAGASRCGDNHWIYKVSPKGDSMKLSMSWEVAAEPGNSKAPALSFDY